MTDIKSGLSSSEVERLTEEGKVNGSSEIKTKSVKQIISENTFTFFNFLNIVLAALVLTFIFALMSSSFGITPVSQ